ncbi:DUF488 domain-containing protein [Flindersiella endophytica]
MSTTAGGIEVRRVYDLGSEPLPGSTFLVDRVWPRGVRKDELRLTDWLKDVAPSTELRQWFGHEPELFAQFRERYRRELAANPAGLEPLLAAARSGPVTLLYAARDEQHNNAVVLREYVLELLGKPA